MATIPQLMGLGMPAALATALAGGGALSVASVPLSASQINHLFSAPQTLLAAPGAGKAICVFKIVVCLTYGTANLTDDGTAPKIYYNNSSGTPVTTVNFDENQSEILDLQSNLSGATAASLIVNSPLVLASATADGIAFGNVVTAVIGNSAGTGYAPTDQFTITTFGGDATFVVDTVGGGGQVLTFHRIDRGDSYSVSSNNHTSTTGGGSGLTMNVTAIQPGDGTAIVNIYYSVVSLPA